MNKRTFHLFSGIVISVFVVLHLSNHMFSVLDAEKHIEVMDALRNFYRNIFIEIILLASVAFQIYSGLILFMSARKSANDFFSKLHIWTGLYLAIFFVIHLSAILAGRWILKLDTNFYFGAAGINTFPLSLFFIPYYIFAILSFFGHIAAVHSKKMKHNLLGINPNFQAVAIICIGVLITIICFYGLTNHFQGFTIPNEYGVLVGR